MRTRQASSNPEWIVLFLLLVTPLVLAQEDRALTIKGLVVDNLAQPVAGAEIAVLEMRGDGFNQPKEAEILGQIVKSDSQGQFTLNASITCRHDVLVVCRKSGFAWKWTHAYRKSRFRRSIVRGLRIILEKPETIAGQLMDAQGMPVRNASVQAVVSILGGSNRMKGPKEWLTVTTDAKGRFAYHSLPMNATVEFLVTTPGRDLAILYPSPLLHGTGGIGYVPDGREARLVLPPGTTIQGKVTEKDTGRGVQNVRLYLYSQSQFIGDDTWRYRPQDLFSEPDGTFSIQGVPPGKHILRLIQPDPGFTEWVTNRVLIKVNDAAEPHMVGMTVQKGQPLDVIVRDKRTGDPLSAMNVQALQGNLIRDPHRGEGFQETVQTDAKGMARLYLPQGMCRLFAWGENYEGPQEGREVHVTDAAMAPLEIALKQSIALVRGRVLDTSRDPVAGAVVQVEHGQEVLTDRHGRFEAMQNSYSPAKIVSARDISRNLAGMATMPKTPREVVIRLQPGVSIAGRIVGENGMGILSSKGGIPAAKVGIHLSKIRVGVIAVTSVFTDDEGYYLITTIMPEKDGFFYELKASAAGYGPAQSVVSIKKNVTRNILVPNDPIRIPDIVLTGEDASISGTVYDAKGQPAAWAPIIAFSEHSGHRRERRTTSDEHGRFMISRIGHGPVELLAKGDTLEKPSRLYGHGGDRDVKFSLGKETTHLQPISLVGQALPDLGALEIGFDSRRIENKKVLVYFVDYTQFPSQKCLEHLNSLQGYLRSHGVEIVCVQVTPANESELQAWKKKNRITLRIDRLPGNTETVKEKWRIRSFPWLVLTDGEHQVASEGFNAGRVALLEKALNEPQKPSKKTTGYNPPRQRRPRVRRRQ